jgi:putative ABC transport system substrate-binding protein
MRRRDFIAVVAVAAPGWPLAARAQRPSGVPHVGVLAPLSPEQTDYRQSLDAFRAGMRELGWTEGGNVVIEVRYANGDPALASANAAAFVAEKVDVIVAIAAAGRPWATATIPIVMDTDIPVESGLVASLARPGSNVTGISNMFTEVQGKQLEMLKEIAPRVGKIGFLAQTGTFRDHAQARLFMKDLEPAAASMGVSLLRVGVDTVEDLPRRFDEMMAAGADGYLVFAEPRTDAMRDAIAALALRHRLPGVAPMRRYADAGVLLSYGPSLSAIHRRQAYFVDRILKGAKPADLPVERPPKFELVVNLKTAKALGLTIPQSILTRADEVIE